MKIHTILCLLMISTLCFMAWGSEVLLDHWSERPIPGQCHLDAWGWHGAIWYQQTYNDGVEFDYITDRVVDESYHWGANLLELYPTMFNPVAWPWSWTEECGIAKPSSYVNREDPDWTNETFRELNRYVHKKNMVVQWFCHPELIPGKKHAPIFDEPEKIAENLNAVRFLNYEFGDATANDWVNLLDGYGHEHWFEDTTGKTAMAQWEYNPGQYTFSTIAWHSADEPQYLSGMMCATTWVLRGRDDQLNLPAEKGVRHLGYQSDSRTFKAPEEVWGGMSKFGGGTWPDWIVKQANDYFRRRLLAVNKPESSGIWWLGETSPVLPEEFRPYVYASSMDPMRLACAGIMRTTGVGGHMDMADAVGKSSGGRIKPRYDFPAGGYFLQNNYVRFEMDPYSGRTRLQYDPSQSGHFDNNSKAEILAEPFMTVGEVCEFNPEHVKSCWKAVKFISAGETEGAFGRWDKKVFPSFLGKEGKYPERIHLNCNLKAGNYFLKFKVKPITDKPTAFYINFNNSFVSSVGVSQNCERVLSFSVQEHGTYDLELVLIEGGGVNFEHFEISGSTKSVQFCREVEVIEPAGHLACLRVKTAIIDNQHKSLGNVISEFRLAADCEGISVKHISDFCSDLSLNFTSVFKNALAKKGNRFEGSSVSGAEYILDTTSSASVDFNGSRELKMVPDKSKKEAYAMFLLNLNENSKFAFSTLKSLGSLDAILVKSGSSGYSFTVSEEEGSLIRLFRIANPARKPYYVREFSNDGKAWWTFRGAQASREFGGTDILRVYSRPGKTNKIIFDGFIDNLLRPGWGSQYQLVLGDPLRDNDRIKVKAKVMSVTPIIFAPRIEFSEKVNNVKVNGKSWNYFEDSIVFLPQDIGEYEISAETGNNYEPVLLRTQALIKDCNYNQATSCLEIEWENVSWSEKLPKDQFYCASIAGNGKIIDKIIGGEIIRKGKKAVNIKMLQREVKIYFKK